MRFISIVVCLLSLSTSFAQYEEVTYKLGRKYFYSKDNLAIVVRYDKGIDSIIFPLDTTKIKARIEKFDEKEKKNEEAGLNNITSYVYYFTPLESCEYKVPNALLWSKNVSHSMIFGDTLSLRKPKLEKKLSKSDSIKLAKENREVTIARQKYYENQRKLTTFTSLLKKGNQKPEFIVWTDKKRYSLKDTIRAVYELNRNFLTDYIDVKKIDFEPYKIWTSSYQDESNNGVDRSSILIMFEADKKGRLKIPAAQINVEGQELKSKRIKVKIKN